jgi:hypothetical protein
MPSGILPQLPDLSSHRAPTFRSLPGGKTDRTPPSAGILCRAPVDAAILGVQDQRASYNTPGSCYWRRKQWADSRPCRPPGARKENVPAPKVSVHGEWRLFPIGQRSRPSNAPADYPDRAAVVPVNRTADRCSHTLCHREKYMVKSMPGRLRDMARCSGCIAGRP